LSRNFDEYPIPPATDNPYPNDPVATSTKGNLKLLYYQYFGTGCPSKRESIFLKFSNSALSMYPANAHAA
jgi:hypothetical protein